MNTYFYYECVCEEATGDTTKTNLFWKKFNDIHDLTICYYAIVYLSCSLGCFLAKCVIQNNRFWNQIYNGNIFDRLANDMLSLSL